MPPEEADDAGAFFDVDATVYDSRVEDPQWTGADVDFYRDLALSADGPAMEVGVGTGRVYLELLAAGLDVDGIDVSQGMLDRLREKADQRGLKPSVWIADVTAFDPDREYGLIYIPARAFNHVIGLENQRAALSRVREALMAGGRLALNTFVPSPEVVANHYGEPQETRVTVDGKPYRVVTTTTLADDVEWVAQIERAVYRGDASEPVEETATPLALVTKREFELLFEATGFSSWTAYGGFDRSPLTDASDEQVWVVDR